MDNKKLTDNEFEKLIQKLMFFDTTRNELHPKYWTNITDSSSTKGITPMNGRR